jgi:hypothetical protein
MADNQHRAGMAVKLLAFLQESKRVFKSMHIHGAEVTPRPNTMFFCFFQVSGRRFQLLPLAGRERSPNNLLVFFVEGSEKVVIEIG